MGCDLELRFTCSPHVTDSGAMSADLMDEIAFLDECCLLVGEPALRI